MTEPTDEPVMTFRGRDTHTVGLIAWYLSPVQLYAVKGPSSVTLTAKHDLRILNRSKTDEAG